jgi:hypothetical protein
VSGRILVVLGDEDGYADRSFGNLPEVQTMVVGELNAYDILVNDWVVFTDETLPGTSTEISEAADADTEADAEAEADTVTADTDTDTDTAGGEATAEATDTVTDTDPAGATDTGSAEADDTVTGSEEGSGS